MAGESDGTSGGGPPPGAADPCLDRRRVVSRAPISTHLEETVATRQEKPAVRSSKCRRLMSGCAIAIAVATSHASIRDRLSRVQTVRCSS